MWLVVVSPREIIQDWGRRTRLIYLIIAMGFAVLVALFAIQNAMPCDIYFFVLEWQYLFAIVVLISVGAGLLIALLSQVMVQIRLRLALRQSEKRIQELELELIKAEALNRDTRFGEKLESNRVLETRGEGV